MQMHLSAYICTLRIWKVANAQSQHLRKIPGNSFRKHSSGRSHWALAPPSHQAPVYRDCCPKAPESPFDRRRGARHALAGCHLIRGIWADDSAAGPAVFCPEESRLYRTLSPAISVELNRYGGNEAADNAGCEIIFLYIGKYYNGLLNDF
jgi:hypothetical protein